MNNIIQTLIQSNTLNFLIVILCLAFIIRKINVGKKLEALKSEIKSYVNEAENEKTAAETRLNKINEKIQKLPNEIARIERSTKNNIEGLSKKTQDDIQEKKQDIDNNVKRIIDLETKKFKSQLTSLLTEASINLAKDNAKKQLENNRAMHDKYIYEAIDEIDGMTL